MGKNFDEVLIDLMPEEEKALFLHSKRVKREYNPQAAREGLAKLLTGTFTTEDGLELSPKDIIDMKTTAFVMANPSPQNTKALYELAGIAAPKQVDVTSDGKSVDSLLAKLAVKSGNEEEEVHS